MRTSIMTAIILSMLMAALTLPAAGCGAASRGLQVKAQGATKLELLVPRAPTGIVIDGQLNEPAWDRSMIATGFVFPWHPSGPQAQTKVYMLWDNQYLYVAFRAGDKDIRSDIVNNQDALWRDGRVMVYLDFGGDNNHYYAIEVNPQGAFASYEADLTQSTPEQKFNPAHWNVTHLKVAARIDGSLNDSHDQDRGYTVELAVPWASMPRAQLLKLAPGSVFRVGLFRIDRSDGLPPDQWPHSMWSTAWDSKPNFHFPDSFVPAVLKE